MYSTGGLADIGTISFSGSTSRKLSGGNPVSFTGTDAHRITPVVGSHTQIRCSNTLYVTAPDIDTDPYIFTPICESRPSPP